MSYKAKQQSEGIYLEKNMSGRSEKSFSENSSESDEDISDVTKSKPYEHEATLPCSSTSTIIKTLIARKKKYVGFKIITGVNVVVSVDL